MTCLEWYCVSFVSRLSVQFPGYMVLATLAARKLSIPTPATAQPIATITHRRHASVVTLLRGATQTTFVIRPGASIVSILRRRPARGFVLTIQTTQMSR